MRLFKFIGILIGVVILNVVIFSPSMLGLSVTSSSTFVKSIALTILIISAIVVFYVSFLYLFKGQEQGKIYIREEEDSDAGFDDQLERYRNHRIYPMEVNLAIEQVSRMEEKKEALLDLLRQRFEQNELSYNRFLSVIKSVEELFNMNVQGLINKLRGSEISKLDQINTRQAQQMFSTKVLLQKQQLHKEYTTYVQGYISSNEEILTKLDRLILETTLLSSNDYRDLDEMPCMKEINVLIEQTKFYK